MKTATQKTRTVRLTETNGTRALVIRQTEGQRVSVDAYFLAAAEGGFVLSKHDTTTYRVHLSGKDSTCSCKGFTRWNHCKHAESLLALQQRGKL